MFDELLKIINACIALAEARGVHPAEVCKKMAAAILMTVAENNYDDNALIIVRKDGQGWKCHIHMDYLSADHDHFKGDFEWNDGTKSEDEHDYSNH